MKSLATILLIQIVTACGVDHVNHRGQSQSSELSREEQIEAMVSSIEMDYVKDENGKISFEIQPESLPAQYSSMSEADQKLFAEILAERADQSAQSLGLVLTVNITKDTVINALSVANQARAGVIDFRQGQMQKRADRVDARGKILSSK